MNLEVLSTACGGEFGGGTCRVTHEFHPLYGREFVVWEVRRNWSESRVFYRGAGDRFLSIPLAWTSLCLLDPFLVLSDSRSVFRCEELLVLRRYLDSLVEDSDDGA